jgi:hypothetical protein
MGTTHQAAKNNKRRLQQGHLYLNQNYKCPCCCFVLALKCYVLAVNFIFLNYQTKK